MLVLHCLRHASDQSDRLISSDANGINEEVMDTTLYEIREL